MKETKKPAATPPIEIEIVTMENVPSPPMGGRGERYSIVYQKVRELGMSERSAVRVLCGDQKGFTAMRTSLRKQAEREGKQLCSSRTIDFRYGYFWVVKPEKP